MPTESDTVERHERAQGDAGLLREVMLEAGEHLSSIEAQLLALERNPADAEAIQSAFRSFHTIKGLAGIIEMTAIEQAAHEVESVLDRVRTASLALTPAVIDVVLAGKDYLERAFRELEPAGAIPDNRPLTERIRRLTDGPADRPEADPTKPADRPEAYPTRLVKVDTSKLDQLVDMAGEMVIAQAQVCQDPDLGAIQSPRLQRNLLQLARATAELQKIALSMRMVPIGQLFRRMPRLVRDLSRSLGKQITLELVGEETELDRTLVEEVSDPLIHMVRNAVDHGIEPPAERRAAGKEPAGRLRLRASHEAGHILIEVSDDGRGLDRRKILEKARRTGLIGEAAELSDDEVFSLILEPGFSTAEQLTGLSGRGVGMDVVRNGLQKLSGRIQIQSVPGSGTAIFLRLPLTLAIVEGLVVGVGQERYIVPLFAIREVFRARREMIWTALGQDEMVLVRGRLLPLVRLYQRFGIQPRTEEPAESVFIVAEDAGRLFCLMVDEFTGKQEVVLKSLGDTISAIPGIAGGAILGDGRVGLVLDLKGIFDHANG